jgi:hypothetical protein
MKFGTCEPPVNRGNGREWYASCVSDPWSKPNLVTELIMLWTIAIILFILWLLGFSVFHVAGGLIHILLVLAIIAVIWRLVTGRPAV